MARVKTMSVKHPQAGALSQCANFHKTGSIRGMKEKYYGKNALLVRCGSYIYNVTPFPHLYDQAH